MKITKITTVQVGAPPDESSLLDRNWTFVIVDTDEGIRGLGECTLLRMELAVSAVLDRMSTFLVGQDPTRVEHLWQQMYRHPFWRGGPIINAAISGLDQAFWDLAGKAAGLPVFRMLGGPVRDRVRCYVRPDFAGPVVDQALEAKSDGFTGFKFGPEPEFGTVSESEIVESAINTARDLRDAVGGEMDLMIDIHGRLSPPKAVACLEALRPFDLFIRRRSDSTRQHHRLRAGRGSGTGSSVGNGRASVHALGVPGADRVSERSNHPAGCVLRGWHLGTAANRGARGDELHSGSPSQSERPRGLRRVSSSGPRRCPTF